MTKANNLQFQSYLQSISDKYKCWWNLYTLTDAKGKKSQDKQLSSPFDFGLMVKTLEPKQTGEKQEQEEIEHLPVLEGIRKYADNHVLLVGKPGSGKSTALARLLLEKAQAHLEINSLASSVNNTSIPILVKLRYWQTSIFERIQAFLQEHDANLNLDETTLKTLLHQGKFLLLIDGVNELPSEDARRQVAVFRKDYPQTPMIFTTRDLGVGDDLGIEKKLKMQSLNETQMRDFVMAYLPQQGEEMLQRLGYRLGEFCQTPLILWMLCELFRQTGNIPSNLGLVFRCFTQSYEKSDELKRDVPVSKESRLWWKSLLEHLAFVMMQGEPVTGFRVAIPKWEVEEIFTKYLTDEKFDKPRDYAKPWLEDLLKYHLIQVGSGDKIEFHHQLLQEYYAAEYLLKRLPKLSDCKLQRDYLNLLKWTEPVTLMLKLVEREAQALRVVQLALEVDLMLGARLAGKVRQEFQDKTVGLIIGLNVTHEVKIHLLGLTRSEQALSLLLEAWNSKDYNSNSYVIAEALADVGYDEAMSTIIKWEDEHLANLNKAAQYENLDDFHLYENIVYELNITSSNTAIYNLVNLLNNKRLISGKGSDYYIKGRNYKAKQVLGKKVFEQSISILLQALNHEDFRVRYHAASALGNIGSKAEVVALTKVVKDENYFVRSSAIDALGKIGCTKADSALIKAVSDEKSFVRSRAVEALGIIRSNLAIPTLIERLNDEKYFVRLKVAEALGKIGNDKKIINALIKALKDEEPDVRKVAAQALGNKGSYLAVNALVCTLKDEEPSVSSTAKHALLNIRKSLIEDKLLKILSDVSIDNFILKLFGLKDKDISVSQAAAYQMSIICSQCLESVLNDSIFFDKYKYLSIDLPAKENIIKHELKYHVWDIFLTIRGRICDMKDTILEIQEKCQFYDYEIFHSPPVEEDKNSDNPTSPNIYIFNQSVGNVNAGNTTIQGNQIGTQNNQQTEFND